MNGEIRTTESKPRISVSQQADPAYGWPQASSSYVNLPGGGGGGGGQK
jgi:hypothetical protein